MTIKNRGGVFGRNPTFNDVDVDGTLSVGGNAVPAANTILVDGDIGVTVQAYDAATAKTNVSQTFTALQNFNFAGGGNYVATFQTTSTSTPYTVNIGETSGSAAGYPLFRVGQSYSPYSDYFRVNSQGNVYASGGVHIGGTAAANELSDYEEGSWTPVATSSGGDASVTTSISSANYTKIGNVVYFNCYISMNVTSVGTGAARITGLPFTNNGGYTPFTSTHETFAGSTGQGWIRPNETNLEFLDANSVSQKNISGTGTKYAMLAGSYITNS